MYRLVDYLNADCFDDECILKACKLKLGLNNCIQRTDDHPSCSVFRASQGGLLYYDHATAKTFTLKDIANQMGCDISHCVGETSKVEEESSKTLSIVLEDWNEENLAYWLDYGISLQTLLLFKVRPVKEYTLNNRTFKRKGYCFRWQEGYVKMYFPNRRPKAISTAPTNLFYPQWALTHPERKHLIITSSVKDAMVLYQCGYPSICFGSENTSYSKVKDIIEFAKARFKAVYVLYDADKAGLRFANILAEKAGIEDLTPAFAKEVEDLDNVKDPSDLVKKTNYERLKTFLSNHIPHI